MKVKTSVTLSSDTIRAVDRVAGKRSSRSRVIEQAILEYLSRRQRAARDRRDIDLINGSAQELNREMADVLRYQADL